MDHTNVVAALFTALWAYFASSFRLFRKISSSLNRPRHAIPPPPPPSARYGATSFVQEKPQKPPSKPIRAGEFAFDGAIIREFLRSMQYDMRKPVIPFNTPLEAEVKRQILEYAAREQIGPQYLKPLLGLLPLCCASTELPYNNHPMDIKVYITIYTVFFLYVDDAAERTPDLMLPDLQELPLKFARGLGEHYDNPNLGYFVRHLVLETPKWFGRYTTGAIIKSTFDNLIGSIIEAKYPRGITAPASSSRFPRFLRAKTGNSEAYGHFMFPEAAFPEDKYLEHILPTIPDIIELIDMINDIMSFYKESVVGKEENTYMMNSARMLECNPALVIKQACERQVMLNREVQQTLQGKGDLRPVFDQFIDGYLMWHGTMKRYRLNELGFHLGTGSGKS